MAQAGYTPIQLYFSTTAAAVPLAANLAQGELAINITDGKLYYENNSGTVTLLASAAGASGDVVGPASATNNALARFDGTTGKLIKDSSALIFDGSNLGVTASSSAGFVGLTTQNTSAGAGASSGLGINNDSTASTYLRTYGSGQTNSLFGSVIANYTALLSDGAASNGILFGTLTNKPIIFGQNNAESMRLTSTGLGIGTSSPTTKLQVVDTSYPYITVSNSSGTQIKNTFGANGVSQVAYLGTVTNHPLGFLINDTERMRLDSSGNLGIGTTTPATRLEIRNDTSNAARVRVTSSATTAGEYRGYEFGNGSIFKGGLLQDQSTDLISIFTPVGGQSFRLDTNGNLGLGVTPSAWQSAAKAMQIGATYSLGLSSFGDDSNMTTNAYYNSSSNWVYQNTASTYKPTRYNQFLGSHIWSVATSTGTAGSTITWTQAMTLDASGNLLVGATSVAGSERLNIVGGTGIRVNEDAVGTKILTLRSDYAGLGPAINVTTSHPLLFLTANTERARITSSGNFLIGTTTSNGGPLKIKGSAASSYSGNLYQGNGASVFRLESGGTPTTNDTVGISIGIGGNAEAYIGAVQNSGGYADIVFQGFAGAYGERARIDSSGNLTVQGPYIANVTGIGYNSSANRTLYVGASNFDGVNNGATFQWGFNVSGDATGQLLKVVRSRRGESETEVARFDNSGNLLVGTTVSRTRLTTSAGEADAPTLGSATGGNAFFGNGSTAYGTLFGTSGFGYGWIQQQRVDGTATAYNLVLQPAGGEVLVGTAIGSGNSGSVGVRKGSTGELILIANNGGLFHQAVANYYLVTTTGGNTSDVTLKKNVQQLSGALAKVCAIRGVNFEFITKQKSTPDNGVQVGVIAQEVEAQYPEIVVTNEDGIKSVRYEKLVAPLIEAIKEQQAIIESLKARLDAANL